MPGSMDVPTIQVVEHMALVPPVVEMIAPDDPPNVTVEVGAPRAEDVERIVEECLRDLTEPGGPLPGTVDGQSEDDPPAIE